MDKVEMSGLTFDFLTFFRGLSSFVGSFEDLLLPLTAFEDSLMLESELLSFFFFGSSSFRGSADIPKPLTASPASSALDFDFLTFLTFFVDFSTETSPTPYSSSAGALRFLLSHVLFWLGWLFSGSSLANLSFRPSFFHAGTCF